MGINFLEDEIHSQFERATHHPRVGILGTVAEGRSQGTGTALVVVSVLPVVNGAINTNGPHTRSVAIAVAIVLLPAVPGSPDVNVTQALSTLVSKQTARGSSIISFDTLLFPLARECDFPFGGKKKINSPNTLRHEIQSRQETKAAASVPGIINDCTVNVIGSLMNALIPLIIATRESVNAIM